MNAHRSSGCGVDLARSGTDEPGGEHLLHGEPIGAGFAIGPAFVVGEDPSLEPGARISHLTREQEHARFSEAVERSIGQLKKLQNRIARLPEETQVEIGPMLEVYQRMLGPSRLKNGVVSRLDDGMTAEAAVYEATAELAELMLASRDERQLVGEDAAAAERRAGEFREIGRRVIRNLMRESFLSLSNMPNGAILVAHTLRPADAALIDPARVAAVVTEDGGSTGHTAIMLRALGVPAVLAVEGLFDHVTDGTTLVVDGYSGSVTVDPSSRTTRQARKQVAAYAQERQELGRMRRLSSRMASGEKISLQANLELPAELPLIAQSGAAGIGLLRTEFLFINAETLPDEATQYDIYAAIVSTMGSDPTTIRVLDWGGEKQGEALIRAGIVGRDSINPALGVRGIRLLLEYPELLETQFAAILRAAAKGPVRVLLPMVTVASEIVAAREIYERVARRLKRKGIETGETLPPLGVMIETPAAALTSGHLAQYADFLAIGSNDLTMYTLAADRASSDVLALYNPLHPAVLRMIGEVFSAAFLERCPVSVCGEIAGNPRLTPLLIGLGCRSFSMSASMVPRVKQIVRHISYNDCRLLARRVLAETDIGEIGRLLDGFQRN
ncbi:phosphoenolpyruvate-protein phosphotransferase [Acetobacter aceti NRIC 0242]|uniref:Phosphoenolpyruvate-protein phosphotransferase n=1 Tax=Acetobacter aceti NBRC 14818 TaxID=887700 RepID=A0AB33IF68_ACEAC|nr:phosphoenolpyruvate--protein phosphotransferase [Acetobacter aceti]TCS32978.1 phosphoenolpyruvate--protein phosphotransferase [Acetobacter aceti NBRC 14818]BCK76406.1 phosphoenolpyruvate-protein phosphotransferase [Acetobacter aceti NBRC 14818]GAN56148.1 phosphoenolpyruvate-protein phosphotransferase [Acetobacter aceti NBRC 14818]GBO81943.1 phosphoenolpyruvate-protein phosphotransferase [Acetobacter aceti NRIC 0242]